MKLLTAKQLADSEIFPSNQRPSERAISDMARRRVIPSVKIGRHRYYDPDVVESHIRNKLTVQAR